MKSDRMRSILCVALTLLPALAAPSAARQTEAERRAEEVRTSDAYRYGEGTGNTPEEAREAACHNLITGIRSLITSATQQDVTEIDTSLTKQYSASTRVLSVMQLEGLEYLELPPRDGHYRYLAFVEEEALQTGMERQRRSIRSMVSQAAAAAAQARLDEALRLSYWAFLLAHTVDTLTVELPGVQLADPRQALLQNIAHILSTVRFQAGTAIQESESIGIPIQATCADRPATLDFSLYTGAGMDYVHVTEGKGYIELFFDPATLTRRRHLLQLRLLYAYEGKMRSFPEIEALHEALGRQDLDTYVELPVLFPFVQEEESPVPPTSPELEPQPPPSPSPDTETPLPLRILAAQTETRDFLEALQAYVRNDRLQYFTQQPPPNPAGIYVAVVDSASVLGIFRVEEEGYLQIRSRQRLSSLRQPEFAGARQIWLIPVEP